MRTPRLLAVAFLGFSLFSAAPAFAADPTPEDIAQARALGEQGQAALDAKKFPEAEKLFTAAAKIYPLAPTLPLGIARAQAGQGHLIAARESYNRVVREWGSNPSLSPAFKTAVDSARTEGDALAPRIANVTITVEGPKEPKVAVDDTNVPAAALGLPRPVDPGTHKLTVSADGYKTEERQFSVGEGGNLEQKVTLEKGSGAAGSATGAGTGASNPPPPPPPPPPPGEGEGKSSRKTIGYVVGGVGAAGIVTGAITGVIALSDHDTLKKNCPTGTCAPKYQSDVNTYNTMGTISTVGFIVGGVGLVAGAVLILTAPKEPKAAFVSPYLGPSEVGVVGRF
jgi:hypothetical protein